MCPAIFHIDVIFTRFYLHGKLSLFFSYIVCRQNISGMKNVDEDWKLYKIPLYTIFRTLAHSVQKH